MRRHGWELPYHPLQVVAVAVFLSLAFSFHVFFAPFVGSRFMELIGISVYSPLMILVFGLYVWCAASNPADPAVLQSKKPLGASPSGTLTSTVATSTGVLRREKNESSTEPSSLAHTSSVHSNTEHIGGDRRAQEASPFHGSTFLCENFPKSACCVGFICPRINRGCSEEDKLYCSLCEVEIYKWSKHCRVCDKCIDGFDHHCRWLNNCIGRKNYSIFIALMISGLCMQFEGEISTRLGSNFSIVPFLSVVAISTVLAAFATLPLGQLCLFHALLIQKGISTYDYIVAMRERDQHLEIEEGFQSPYMSPASSVATAMSGASSTGALHHAAWCTPPHLFVDHEQEPIKFGLEATKRTSVDKNTGKKLPAKISPWALAKLNPEVALRATAEAKKRSSVFRPVVSKLPPAVVIAETDSSDECSNGVVGGGWIVASSQPTEDSKKLPNHPLLPGRQFEGQPMRQGGNVPKVRVMLGGNSRGYLEHNRDRGFLELSREMGHSLTPLQLEARNAFCGSSGVLEARVSTSTESSEGSSANPTRDLPSAHRQPHSCYKHTSQFLPLPVPRNLNQRVDGGIGCHGFHGNNENDDDAEVFSSVLRLPSTTCTSDGYEASGGESAEDESDHFQDQREDGVMVGRVAFMERNHPSQKVGHSRPQFHMNPNLPPSRI